MAKQKPSQKPPVTSTQRNNGMRGRVSRISDSEAKLEMPMTSTWPPGLLTQQLLGASNEQPIEMWHIDEQPISLAEILMDGEDTTEKNVDPSDGMHRSYKQCATLQD